MPKTTHPAVRALAQAIGRGELTVDDASAQLFDQAPPDIDPHLLSTDDDTLDAHPAAYLFDALGACADDDRSAPAAKLLCAAVLAEAADYALVAEVFGEDYEDAVADITTTSDPGEALQIAAEHVGLMGES